MDVKKFIQRQKMMTTVLIALCPIVVASIFFYGWRTLAVQIVVLAAAYLSEYAFVKKDKKPVTEAVIVTSILYTLTLPPSIPYWIAVVGIVFGVVFLAKWFLAVLQKMFLTQRLWVVHSSMCASRIL